MASGKITKRSVDALISIGAECFLWDEGLKGFGAKITKSGAVSYNLAAQIASDHREPLAGWKPARTICHILDRETPSW